MAALTPAELVAVWEAGHKLPDCEKALVALAPALPGTDPHHLRALSIGARNAHLLALRRDTFGPVMRAFVKCPACSEPLEFEQDIAELLAGYRAPAASEFTLHIDGHELSCRMPDSSDLAAASQLFFQEEVAEALFERSVLDVRLHGEALPLTALPHDLRLQVQAEIAGRDPLSQIAIPLGCAACRHVWHAGLEIVAFFWTEIERMARAVLDDVVQLARGYGWREDDILAMSPQRRQFYLEAMA